MVNLGDHGRCGGYRCPGRQIEFLFVGHPDCVVGLKTMFGSKTGWQFMRSMMWGLGGGGGGRAGGLGKR